jgi:dipeptide/tripeptide permease
VNVLLTAVGLLLFKAMSSSLQKMVVVKQMLWENGQAAATALSNFFTFFCYVTPLLGAFVADQYLGRYRTILLFSSFYLTGWIILTCTATLASLATGAGFSGYVISLIIIGLGTGSIKRYEQVTRRAHRSPEPADDNLLHIEI